MSYIQGADRNQILLFPECMDDYIEENSCVRLIDEYIESLNLNKLGFKKAIPSKIGRPPYNPKDLLKLYIYGYLNRIRSSRRLEQESKRNLELIWLLNKLTPDFKTIADFRKDNKKALQKVFRDFNKLCDEWGLFGKELVAVDGSKFKASNSKKSNFSIKKLERHIKFIDEKIDKYLKDLDSQDTEEDVVDRKLDVNEIKDKIKKIKKIKERKIKYEDMKSSLLKSGEKEISLIDPDARVMSSNNNGVDVSYNIQSTVDSKHKLILDYKVTNNANDIGELDNMALRTKKIFNGADFEILADKGYYKATDLKKCVKNGITPYVTKQLYSNGTGDKDFYSDNFIYDKERDIYICPSGKELNYFRKRKKDGKIIANTYQNFIACEDCEFKLRCTKSEKGRQINRHVDQDFLDKINLKTELNMDKYRLRQMIVEHPFGTIKRAFEASYFLTRRKKSVSTEISLSFLIYNLKRVINILGIDEMMKRIQKRRKLTLV